MVWPMKNKVQIRLVENRDNPTICDLLEQLGYRQSSEQLQEKLGTVREGRHVFVAELDGQVVGFMSLHIMDWIHSPVPAARLSAVVVDARYRREGIGRALVAFAETKASQLGCSYIELTSSLRRKADGTYDFYDALGYQRAQETTYFRKPLGKISP